VTSTILLLSLRKVKKNMGYPGYFKKDVTQIFKAGNMDIQGDGTKVRGKKRVIRMNHPAKKLVGMVNRSTKPFSGSVFCKCVW
jgi:hypothetical protein